MTQSPPRSDLPGGATTEGEYRYQRGNSVRPGNARNPYEPTAAESAEPARKPRPTPHAGPQLRPEPAPDVFPAFASPAQQEGAAPRAGQGCLPEPCSNRANYRWTHGTGRRSPQAATARCWTGYVRLQLRLQPEPV